MTLFYLFYVIQQNEHLFFLLTVSLLQVLTMCLEYYKMKLCNNLFQSIVPPGTI